MPSITALLGLLAIAGYQNRDKLAEMLNGAGASNPELGDSTPQLGGLLGNLSGMLGGTGLVVCSTAASASYSKFKQNGQGETAQSWINHGPNREVSPS